MSVGDLSAEEYKDLELDNVPAINRKGKIAERARVREKLGDPTAPESGGMSSSLDPLNFHKLEKGEPTVELPREEIKVSKN